MPPHGYGMTEPNVRGMIDASRAALARDRKEHHLHLQSREAMEEYFSLCMISNSATSEHLPTLRRLAGECWTVAELGTWHGDSAFAMMMGTPTRMICVDIEEPKYMPALVAAAEYYEINFEFRQTDTRTTELPEVDMMFVDSLPTYEQVRDELKAHIDKVKKYLVFHDVDTYFPIRQAIKEFADKDFDLVEQHHNSHGLWVMQRRI